jgi:hypothetical protein
VPVPAELMRLWNDNMHEEYRDLDGDFVFVNLWGGQIGRPLTYKMVDKRSARLGRSCGPRTYGARPNCRTAIWPACIAARSSSVLSGSPSRG